MPFILLFRVMPAGAELRIAPASRLPALLRNPRLLSVYAITILSFGGSTMAFTYFPTLLGARDVNISLYMTVFGAGAVIGNLAGGRLSDRLGFSRATAIAIFGLIACLAFLPAALVHSASLPAVLFVWGLFAFSLPAILQTQAVRIARAHGLAAAASSLNTASFNIGIGGASVLASLLVETAGVPVVPTVGACMASLALVLMGAEKLLRRGAP